MTEVRKTMKEKGIPSELVKENKVDLLQVLTKEDETRKVFQELKHWQEKSHNNLHKHFQKHKKILADLTENYDEIGHEIKLFHKCLSMIETQCEQITSGYQNFLRDDKDIPVSTNVVTRRAAVVTGPLGPP